jgi:hypothetical protein
MVPILSKAAKLPGYIAGQAHYREQLKHEGAYFAATALAESLEFTRLSILFATGPAARL